MAAPSPAYLWYPKDALSSGRVSALSPLEELWYRRALDHSWLCSGLPADPEQFAGWVGRGCTVEAAQKLISIFFVPSRKDPQKVVNPRQEEERKKYLKKSQERSKAGIESGRKRRERSALGAEQMFNKTRTKSNIPIPIATSINNTHTTPAREMPSLAEQDLSDYPISDLINAFPEVVFTPGGLGQICATVADTPQAREAWANTVATYRGNYDPSKNSWMPNKAGSVLSVYRRELADIERRQNGNGKSSEREKSTTRRINAERMAEAIALGDEATLADILGGNGQDRLKGYLPS